MAPSWMMEKMSNNDYTDSVVEEAYVQELTSLVREQFQSKLLYGPVVIAEEEESVCGFLAADGDLLENLWYGIWDRSSDAVSVIRLFE